MTAVAVIADVHANLAALEAVLEDLDRRGVDDVVCLGDVVGYHAEPAACVALVRARCRLVVAGNHDRDLGRPPGPGTHAAARHVQAWTHAQLTADELAWLAALPSHHVGPTMVAAHGAYLSDVFVSGYVTSTMLEHNLRAIAARPGWPPLALCGHTHVPMVAWWSHGGVDEHLGDGEASWARAWPAAAHVALVNPGSVGQPRDGDVRASYALVDPAARRAEIHRVPYDVERTCAAIAAAGLPDELAVRLRAGR